MIYQNILEMIGNTPILKLNRIVDKTCAQVYLKLEMRNVTGSVKDRAALSMVEAAEADGTLKPGSTIIESTSGNLGVSLSAIANMRGYHFVCVLDPKAEPAKIQLMKVYGAKIIWVTTPDANGGFQKPRIAKVKELLKKISDSINLDQYNNPLNPLAHRRSTGPELFYEFKDRLDVLVAAVSTGGTICGTATFLKKRFPNVKIVGVEPKGSVIFGGTSKTYLQQGSGLSFIPGNFNKSLLTQTRKVTDTDAFRTAHLLVRKEGILVGGSGGAVVFTALNIARSLPQGTVVVGIIPDGGEKYLETIYNEGWLRKNKMNIINIAI